MQAKTAGFSSTNNNKTSTKAKYTTEICFM